MHDVCSVGGPACILECTHLGVKEEDTKGQVSEHDVEHDDLDVVCDAGGWWPGMMTTRGASALRKVWAWDTREVIGHARGTPQGRPSHGHVGVGSREAPMCTHRSSQRERESSRTRRKATREGRGSTRRSRRPSAPRRRRSDTPGRLLPLAECRRSD